MIDVEAVLLTGGASRRMGVDKAKIVIDGEPLGERLAVLLATAAEPVTVLGREPVRGAAFLADEEAYAGPLAALRRFVPTKPFVFIASCDLPTFEPILVPLLKKLIGDAEACVPIADGRLQPLCALYRSDALVKIPGANARIMKWVEGLEVRRVEVEELITAGIEPSAVRGVNTPEDLAAANLSLRTCSPHHEP